MKFSALAVLALLLLPGCFRDVEIRDRSGVPVPDALVISVGVNYFTGGICYASLSDANGKAGVQEHCAVYVLKRGYLPVEDVYGYRDALILDASPDAIPADELHERRLWCPVSDIYSKIDSGVPGLVVEARTSDQPSGENPQAPLDDDICIGAVEIDYRVSAPQGKLYRHARFYGKLDDSEIFGPMSELELKGNNAFVFSDNGKHYKMFLTNGGTPDSKPGSSSFSKLLFTGIPSVRTPVFPKDFIRRGLWFSTNKRYYKGPLDPKVAMERYNSEIAYLKTLQQNGPLQPSK